MVQFNLDPRELTLKVVYYGPALSGKTTNLQAIHAMMPTDRVGRIMALETRDDRTLFFDRLPLFFKSRNGTRVKVKVFTVPGQAMHDSTRQVVLQDADSVAFIADSQISETEANRTAWRDLKANFKKCGREPRDVPMVIQFNKRDLERIRSEEELRALEARRGTPIIRASAIQGRGVIETLRTLLSLTWSHLDVRHEAWPELGISKSEFMQALFGQIRSDQLPPGGPR